jgi:hypothetical protein
MGTRDMKPIVITWPQVIRMLSKTEDIAGCMRWTGWIDKTTGYGRYTVAKKKFYVHRWFYTFYKGPIPEGALIDHLCRNRWCVNPDHLEAVTDRTNIVRGTANQKRRESRKPECIRGHPREGNRNAFNQCRPCNQIRKKNRKLAAKNSSSN